MKLINWFIVGGRVTRKGVLSTSSNNYCATPFLKGISDINTIFVLVFFVLSLILFYVAIYKKHIAFFEKTNKQTKAIWLIVCFFLLASLVVTLYNRDCFDGLKDVAYQKSVFYMTALLMPPSLGLLYVINSKLKKSSKFLILLISSLLIIFPLPWILSFLLNPEIETHIKHIIQIIPLVVLVFFQTIIYLQLLSSKTLKWKERTKLFFKIFIVISWVYLFYINLF